MRVAVVVLAALSFFSAASVAAQRSRERVSLVFRGESALQRQELDAAVAAFREAARDSSARRRAAAERMLAFIEWRFHRRFQSASAHLDRALATGEDSAATLVESARVASAQGSYHEAFGLAQRARIAARDDFASRGATLQMAYALLEPVFVQRVDGMTVPPSELPDSAAIRTAMTELQQLVRETPGRTEESRQLLLLALLAGDGPAAAEALQSYYLIGIGSGTQDALRRTERRLAQPLIAWRGSRATTRERATLAALLAEARLFDAAGLVAPRSSELLAYAAYGRRMAREAQNYYRRVLLQQATTDELTRAFYRASRDLWPRLDWSDRPSPPPFYPAAIGPELARRFGTVVQLGITGGYYDLHMGHVIGEEIFETVQYGRRARLRLLVIDGLISNGLQSWAWDDAGAHGGWQRRDTVVQVRPVFVEHTIALWLTGDASRRERETVNTAADSVADWIIAAENPISFLPGVAARLRRDARDDLLDSLRTAGLVGTTLAAEFIRTASRLSHESSILAHEARHAIDDMLTPRVNTEEREFRAKLSEIAFSGHPKLVFSSIMHPNIGDATPHGRANARIMTGLAAWIRVHATEIRGLDPSRPLLPQLPLLTEEQLRRAFRSMDPLATPAR